MKEMPTQNTMIPSWSVYIQYLDYDPISLSSSLPIGHRSKNCHQNSSTTFWHKCMHAQTHQPDCI